MSDGLVLGGNVGFDPVTGFAEGSPTGESVCRLGAFVGLNDDVIGVIVGIDVSTSVDSIVELEVEMIVGSTEGLKVGESVGVWVGSIVFEVDGTFDGNTEDRGSELAGAAKGVSVVKFDTTIVSGSTAEVLLDGVEVTLTLDGAETGFAIGLRQTGAEPVSVIN